MSVVKQKEGYTSKKFQEFYPERKEIALDMLAKGYTIKAVAKKVKADKRTIRAFQLDQIKKIEDRREEALNVVFPGMVMTAEHAIEKLPECSGYQAAGMHGILRDTFLHLSNIPTIRAEVTHRIDFVAELQALKEEARARVEEMKRIEGKDVTLQLPDNKFQAETVPDVEARIPKESEEPGSPPGSSL